MWTQIKIEAYYDNVDQAMNSFRKMTNAISPGLGDQTFGKPDHPYWVAQIIDFDPHFKYKREFIRGKKDYSEANSKGSRGVFVFYLLESGNIYEVKTYKSRYFCKVNQEGEIIKMTKEEVDKWLKELSDLPF